MRFIKAVKIFDGAHFLSNNSVLVFKDARLMEVAHEDSVGTDRIERFDGILTPGFINAHCHLELSHLRGKLKRGNGFCDFALSLMAERPKDTLQLRHAAMQEAAAAMRKKGIRAIGDVSNSNESFIVKKNFPDLYFHTFVELIGFDPAGARSAFEKGASLLRELRAAALEGSLAPHAPYSVSPELLSMIVSFDASEKSCLTIHTQETIEETRFFMGEICGMHRLYRDLGIDISFFRPPRAASITHILPLLKNLRSILVHNTFSTHEDVEQAADANVSWCFCPRANLFIESRMPDYSLFRSHARRLCVGTDSLASNESLDVLCELNEIAEAAPFFSEEQLLAMITSNGAEALGISDRFGHLAAGASPGLNLIRRNGTKFELERTIL